MPTLDVEIVGEVSGDVGQGLAQRLADATGEVLGSRSQGTWVKVRFLEEEAYAENGGGPPDGVLPVLVSVLQFERPEGRQLSRLASSLTQAVAEACERPMENVHVVFEPPAAGRIAFGGLLRR